MAPKQPIAKSLASPRLLAGIATNKYQDGLPLYHQQAVLKRIGIDLPRAALAELDDSVRRVTHTLNQLTSRSIA